MDATRSLVLVIYTPFTQYTSNTLLSLRDGRQADKDMTIEGYLVLKDTSVQLSVCSVHLSPASLPSQTQ